MEILFLGAIILVALVLFVTELFPIDVTALLVLGLLLILGLVSPTESLAGFLILQSLQLLAYLF